MSGESPQTMNRDAVEPTISSFPGPNATNWANRHHQYAAPSTYAYEFVWNITEEAIGPFVKDVDGNVLMDFTSHVAAAPLGYNNPMIMERLEEFSLVDPLKIAGQDFYTASDDSPDEPSFPGPTHLMERLVETTDQYDLDTVFLSNSGAEAVENAIKISYAGGGHRGVTTDGAFHGRTLGALSLNRSKAKHRTGYPEVPGVISIPFCTCDDYETCDCGWRTNGVTGTRLGDKLHPKQGVLNPEEVAYVILEPMQGEGGYRLPNEEFLSDVNSLCSTYNLNLIADEIQSGMGRTGEFWASDHFESFDPDVITSAKALRVGATIANEEAFPSESGRLSSTWGAGDILSSLQGVLTIDAIHENDLLANASRQGNNLVERLIDSLQGDLDSRKVHDVRGLGLMVGVEFETQALRDDVCDAALQEGLMTLGCGHRTLRLLPPLDVTDREIEIAVDLFTNAVENET